MYHRITINIHDSEHLESAITLDIPEAKALAEQEGKVVSSGSQG